MTRRALAIATSLAILASAGTAGATEAFRARLSGAQEVPPVATDTQGRFKIQFSKDYSSAEYTLRVAGGTRLTQAHLHCAPAGINGPVIVFLAGNHANGWDVDGKWIDNATVTNANIVNALCGGTLAEIAQAARNGLVYANVHSIAAPAGVVRGQLEAGGDD